jgi:drug/metabolite transporter (DMT)-like permease
MTIVSQRAALRTASLTILALVAFAANSLLCRLALAATQIDAASYTSLRLLSGAATLWAIVAFTGRSTIADHGGGWVSAAMLFLYAVPFALVVSLLVLADFEVTARGAWLAVLSGAVASGLGYVIWYAALKGLTTTRAAVVQLSVPMLAAIGGVLFLAEAITHRLVLSSVIILGGIALTIWGRDYAARVRVKTSDG